MNQVPTEFLGLNFAQKYFKHLEDLVPITKNLIWGVFNADTYVKCAQ